MHRPRQPASAPLRQQRQRLAHEAARLMAEGGIADYSQARRKAAQRLGIHDDAAQPRNTEIEQALHEYQRLFAGPGHAADVRRRREAALQAMDFLHVFSPRLAGPVLDGTAGARSPVLLHLHCDDAEAVPRFLDEHGIPAGSRMRRLRLDARRTQDAPAWEFSAGDIAFELVVLPYDALRQAPLSPLDEKPQRRASATQLRQLLADSTEDTDHRPAR